MKIGIFCALLIFKSASAAPDNDHEPHKPRKDRLCPTNYIYLGDDTKSFWKLHDGMIEVDRSPVYSCYKHVKEPDNWVSANLKCIEDKAQLVSFESIEEFDRFNRFAEESLKYEGDTTVFTSGINLGGSENANWFWLGGNASIDVDLLEDIEPTFNCLGLAIQTDSDNETSLVPINCLKKHQFICESRVQTVTYYTWFLSNWFTFLLGFLLIVLVLTLCISVSMYSKKNPNPRVYRRQAMPGDLPPTYQETVNPANRLDHYRNKGRELLARVYVTRSEKPPLPN